MGTTVLDRTSTKDPLITVMKKIGRSRVKMLLPYLLPQSSNHTLTPLALFPCFLLSFFQKLSQTFRPPFCIVFAVMGGSGEKRVKGFQGKKEGFRGGVPKGCLAIKVGQGEDQQRFVVPVMYFNHPLFMQLLKEAEEEYGFDQKGTITIPCHVEQFRNVRGIIDSEKSLLHNNHVRCFGF
ncbi:Auxin-responsive protein [Vigna angularis]|uniref:Auxin-responsive protein n=1 Tax=Phaseolus angularis TaxID=3914 RepID=A0A8T0K7B2_PHAAN|nr:Auxin-responsive protein [Vigna angularis]